MPKEIKAGVIVTVPEPIDGGDEWMWGFVGTIINIVEPNQIAVVKDRDGDLWHVPIDRLSIVS